MPNRNYELYDRIATIAPGHRIAHWVCEERAGTAIKDCTGHLADAVATSVTLDQPTLGDGRRCASFAGGGSASQINVYSSALNTIFNGQEGAAVVFAKPSSTAVWSSGLSKNLLRIEVDSNNGVFMTGDDALAQVNWNYVGGAGSAQVVRGNMGSWDTPFMMGMIWSFSRLLMQAIFNGRVEGTAAITAAYTGSLSTLRCNLGCRQASNSVWDGFIGQVAVWDIPISLSDMGTLWPIWR